MRTAGGFLTQIQDQINEHNDDEFVGIILRAIGRAYKDVMGEHLWPDSLNIFEPSDTICATLPVLLPANLRRIKSVKDASNTYYENFTRGRVCVHPYNWFYDIPVKAALQSGSSATVAKDTTSVTITGTTFGASVVGEWIQIGQSEDVYLIATRTSNTEVQLSLPFRSEEDVATVPWRIRPEGTRYINFVDKASVAVNPTTLEIEYQEQPLSIISENDYIALPDDAADAVLIRALQYSMQRKAWGRQAAALEPDYRHKIALAKRESPASKDALTPKRMFARPVQQDILRRTS